MCVRHANRIYLFDNFECTSKDKTCRRAVCKKCYSKSKVEKAKEKSSKVDQKSIPKPRCVECNMTSPEVDFTWRSDISKGGWRSTCQDCVGKKEYCKSSRATRRAKDEKAYLAKNAATHLEWTRRNKDKVAAQRQKSKSDPMRRWKSLHVYLRQKHGNEWEKFLCLDDEDGLIARLQEPCFYCNHASGENETLNGLDRVDSNGIYSLANTVACCAVCNTMKNIAPVDEFILIVRNIFEFRQNKCNDDMLTFATTSRPPSFGKDDARISMMKVKDDYLTRAQKMDLWTSPCYLCGRSPSFGIDRVDASIGYVFENCKGCCSQCNYQKKDWGLQEFLGHISRIYDHTKTWTIGVVSTNSTPSGSRKPVSVIDTSTRNPVVIFPSIDVLKMMLGRIKDFTINDSSVVEYNMQHIEKDAMKESIRSLTGL